MKQLHITECPRDAMQGIKTFIPTHLKVKYIQQLLRVGFDVLDFGSFVSPKVIPQMQDTADVLQHLDLSDTDTQLLAIIANYKGAEKAVSFNQITYLGFPLSISEEFQKRNTKATIADALQLIETIQNLCVKHHKTLRVYLSMAFGNPYNEEWSAEKVIQMANKLYQMGIQHIALADTIGCSTPQTIQYLFHTLTHELPQIVWIAHLHSTPHTAAEKIQTAIQNNCIHFDTALLGYGGCPMAKDELTGNIATEILLNYAQQHNLYTRLNNDELKKAQEIAQTIFSEYH